MTINDLSPVEQDLVQGYVECAVLLKWCTDHAGECLVDHPKIRAAAVAALTRTAGLRRERDNAR
jgi:hypothetical protein